MDRRRAAGSLLALAACFAFAAAAPTAGNHTALDLYDGAPDGCYYNFQHYGEGDRIMTNEPCLNCTCHNRMLMCYLRVCPFTKPIGQDCTIEKRADQCCPIVTCPDVPVDLLTSTTNSPAEYGATGLGKLDKYGCSINGKYFPEGSKVPPMPNKPCEHCYCIRNMTTCVMQECTLHVDGCTPIYHKDVCCPVRYSCDHPEDEIPLLDDLSTTVRPTPGFLLTTTTLSPVTQISQDCVYDSQIFPDGDLIKTEKACDHCYCMKGDIVCVVQECGTPMENEGKNCTALPPREGVCCPDTYICEGDEPNSESYDENQLTTNLPQETLTTLSPPRRAGSEGSGYRNEDTTPYTETPLKEPEVEGSGDEQEATDSTQPTDSLSSTDEIEEPHEYISVTSTRAPTEQPGSTTSVPKTEGSSTEKHQDLDQELGSGEEEGDSVTETSQTITQAEIESTSRFAHDDELTKITQEPESQVQITSTSTPYKEEGTTIRLHEPEIISDAKTSSPHGEEGSTIKSYEPEIVSDITTSSPHVEEGTTMRSYEPEYVSEITTSSPHVEEGSTIKSYEPEIVSDITTGSPHVDEGTTIKSYEPDIVSDITTSSPHGEEGSTIKSYEPEIVSDITTGSPHVDEGTTIRSYEPEIVSEITTSSPHVEEGSTIKSYEPEIVSDITTGSPRVEEGTTIRSFEPEIHRDITTSSPHVEEGTTIKSFEPETDTEIKTTDLPQSYPDTKDKTTEEDSKYEPQPTTEIVTSDVEYDSQETTPQQYSPSTSLAPGIEAEISTESQDMVTERVEEPDLEPHPHYGVTASTPMLEEIEKETTEYDIKPSSSIPIVPTDISTSQPISESVDEQETEPQSTEYDTSDYITTMSPTFEKDDTETLDPHKVTEADESVLQYSPTTLAPSLDEEDKKTSSEEPTKDTKTESYTHSTTASLPEHSEQTTAEPDKGLNTIPGTLEEEHTVEPSEIGKTTVSDEKQGTETHIPVDTRFNDTPDSSTSLPSVETSTKKETEAEPTESITTAADKVTVPPTKSDIQTESSAAEKQTPAEQHEVTLKPTYESTEVQTDRDNVVPTLSYDKVSETTIANLEENEIFNEPRIPGEGDCLINGVTYRNESSVPSTNKCSSDCKCVSSIVKCVPMICSPPPEYMENCRTMYDPSDSCCPTYVCDHKTETMPPQPHSQMSGTESPSTAPVLCQGDQCEIQIDKKPTEETSKPCASGNCESDENLGANIPVSETDVQCTQESGCQVPPSKLCEGDECKTTFDKIEPEQQPCTSSDCNIPPTKEADIPKESCQDEEGCKIDQEPVELECKDGNCRRKDESQSEQQPSIQCSGSECQHTDISSSVESSTQKDEYPLEFNKPESGFTKPSEESTSMELSKLPDEPSSQLTTAAVDKSEEIIPTTQEFKFPAELETTKFIEATVSTEPSQYTEITKFINEHSTETSLTDVEEASKPTEDIRTEPPKSSTPTDMTQSNIDIKSPDEDKIESTIMAGSETTTVPEIQKEVTTLSDNLLTIKEDSKPASGYEPMDDSVTKLFEESHTESSKISETDQEKSSTRPSSETTTELFEITESLKSTQTQEGEEGKKATTKAIEMSTESYESPEAVTSSVESDKDTTLEGITTDATKASQPSEITQAPLSEERETEPTKIFETQPEKTTDSTKVSSEEEITHAPEDESETSTRSQDIYDQSLPGTNETDNDIEIPSKFDKDIIEPHLEKVSTEIPTTAYEKEEESTTISKFEAEPSKTTILQDSGETEKTTMKPIIQEVETATTITSEMSNIVPDDIKTEIEDSAKPAEPDENLQVTETVTQKFDSSSTEQDIFYSTTKEVSDEVSHTDITESAYDREHDKPATATSVNEPEDNYTQTTDISDSVPTVTVVPEIEDTADISTTIPHKSSVEEAEISEGKPEMSTKSPEDEILVSKEPESTIISEIHEPEKDVSPTESSEKATEKIITESETEQEVPTTDKYEDMEPETSKPFIESPKTTSSPIFDVTTKLAAEVTTEVPSKITTISVSDFEFSSKKDSDDVTTELSRTSEIDSEKPSTESESEETQEMVTKPLEEESVEPSKQPEGETQKESITPETDLMTELPIKSPELEDKYHTVSYDLATEKPTSPQTTDVKEKERVTEPGTIYEEITKATPEVDESDKFTTKPTDYAGTEPSQISEEELEKSSKPSEDVTTPVTYKEEDIVTSKIETETSSIKQDMEEESEPKVTEPVDEELQKPTPPPSVLDSESASVTSEEAAATPIITHDLVTDKVPLSPQEIDSATKTIVDSTTEAFDKLSGEEESKISSTTKISDEQTTEPTRKFDLEPVSVTISPETGEADENVTTDSKEVSDIEKPATESSVPVDKTSTPEKDDLDVEIETSTKLEEPKVPSDTESDLVSVIQATFTTRQPITDLTSSELPQDSSTEIFLPSYTTTERVQEHDRINTDSAETSTELPDVPYKESETSAPEKDITKPSDLDKYQDVTEVAPTPSEEKPEDIPVLDVVETTTGHLDKMTPEREQFETSPKTEIVSESAELEPAEITTISPKKEEEVPVTTDKQVQPDIAVQTEKEQDVVESITPKEESSTSLVEDNQTTLSIPGEVSESVTQSSPPLDGSVPPVETSGPQSVTVSEDSDKTIDSEEPAAIPVQTEKVPDLIEKPLPEKPQYTTSSEEDHILSTTRATTIKTEEELPTTSPSDRITKPEEKPTEPPATPAPEQPKPIPSEPTDELPSPDEDAQFPPSGPNGYGQEPDYMEEDQTFGPGTCRYGGKVYVSAQQIPRDDPCDFCFCFRSDIICLQQSCPPPIHGCHEEPIQGFCCPRYECPVSMATTVNVTTTTTTTTTTLPPHFPIHSYKGSAQRKGCLIKGQTYKVGDVVRSSSGPCLHCTCGGDGQMKCDPKACTPEPMLRQMIAAAVSAKRRR